MRDNHDGTKSQTHADAAAALRGRWMAGLARRAAAATPPTTRETLAQLVEWLWLDAGLLSIVRTLRSWANDSCDALLMKFSFS